MAHLSPPLGQAAAPAATHSPLAAGSSADSRAARPRIDEVRAMADRSVRPTKFDFYRFVPLELQIMVARAALPEPAIHFIRLERCITDKTQLRTKYEIQTRPTQKDLDPSPFRQTMKVLMGLVGIVMSTDLAVRPQALGFKRLPSLIDAATDMVCVHKVYKSASVRWAGFRTTGDYHPSFHPDSRWNADGHPTLDRLALSKTVAGIRHVGVMFGKYEDASLKNFPCPVLHGLHGRRPHTDSPLCSVELVAFLHCFPDLEVVYIVMKSQMTDGVCSWPPGAEDYCSAYFSKTQAERDALDLKVFYDDEQAYVEFTTAFFDTLGGRPYTLMQDVMIGRLKPISRLLQETSNVFHEKYHELPTNVGAICSDHAMSLERRQAVKFKIMLTSGIRTGPKVREEGEDRAS